MEQNPLQEEEEYPLQEEEGLDPRFSTKSGHSKIKD